MRRPIMGIVPHCCVQALIARAGSQAMAQKQAHPGFSEVHKTMLFSVLINWSDLYTAALFERNLTRTAYAVYASPNIVRRVVAAAAQGGWARH